MEDDGGRKRRSIKPKAFSPEPEPVRKPKVKQTARASTGKTKPKTALLNLSAPEPAPNSPTVSLIPGTHKLLLSLGSASTSVSQPAPSVKAKNGSKKANQNQPVNNFGPRLKLGRDYDEEKEPSPFNDNIVEEKVVESKNVDVVSPLKKISIESKPDVSVPTSTGPHIPQNEPAETSESVKDVAEQSTSMEVDEKTNLPSTETVHLPQGKTVLVGKSMTPVVIATSNLAERRISEGRTRRPPPSKEYCPEPIKKTPKKKPPSIPKPQLHPPSPQFQKPAFIRIPPPSAPVTSIPPVFELPQSAPLPSPSIPYNMSIYQRQGRNKAKNLSELAPSLLSRKEQARIRPVNIVPPQRHEPSFVPKANVFRYPPRPITSPKAAPRVSLRVESSPEIESPIDQSDPETLPFFGNPIEYLKSLIPDAPKWLTPLEETRFRNEFFYRAMFMEEETTAEVKKKIISTNLVEIMNRLDIKDRNEKAFDAMKIDDEIIDIETVDNDTNISLFNQHLFHQVVMPYAEKLIGLLPGNRLSFDDMEKKCDALNKFCNPAYAELSHCVSSILNIVKDQHLIEHVYSTKEKGLTGFYNYTLRNAERFRVLLFQKFSLALVGAHETMLYSLELQHLCSYLNILRFLKATGTSSGSMLVSHASPKFETAKQVVAEVLDLKVRDPYHRILTAPGRKLRAKNVYLLVVYPGVFDESSPYKPIYHSHEAIFRQGLPNIGAAIEKVLIRKKFPTSPSASQLADWAVKFMRDKLREVVLRRSKDRIFVACWGSASLYVHQAVLDVDGISGIIDFAMPLRTPYGFRGLAGDSICYTYCPTLLVMGENAKMSSKEEIAMLRRNMLGSTSLLTVGKADDSLYLPPDYMAKKGITSACVNRLIVEHIIDFIDKVMEKTKQGVHTIHIKNPDRASILVDANELIFEDDEVPIKKRPKSPKQQRSETDVKNMDFEPASTSGMASHDEADHKEQVEMETKTTEEPEHFSDAESDDQSEKHEHEENVEEENPEGDYDEDLAREAQEAAAALESNLEEEMFFES
uniref:Uncharacterized protein n=1 Tax=Panagrolaimus sp. JU765 TaxID=591449 RepID=A0AC34QPF2_9BILA